MKIKRNLSMLTDFYELTMGNGYLKSGMADTVAYFDMFFRKIPDAGGFVINAGLEQLVEYFQNLCFEDEDIEFLRSKGIFSEEFLDYLKNFKFSCDVWAIPEGTPVFPHEPLLTIRGPIIQCQLVETMVLLTINHQSLIATKSNRVVRAANGRGVMEFGSRRAQGYDGALLGARAAYIGGCIGTACTLAEKEYGVPALGTMAHSWVQSFDTEYEAFKAYAETYPDGTLLLVDTYNTLKSGVPNAIKIHNEVLKPMGKSLSGIRIDSGDLAYLSKEARKMLDSAGLFDCKIVASSSLDEYLIRDIISQGAEVDLFGVGENLITSKSSPVFGGVYKIVAVEKEGEIVPRIKLSDNPEKVTTPGYKRVYRFYDTNSDKARGDLLTMPNETIDTSREYVLFDPVHTWKKTVLKDYYVKELQVQVFKDGELVYKLPTLPEIKEYSEREVSKLWDEMMRFEFPQKYHVDLSEQLWELKMNMLQK
ncbi:nicotinate phosphoribosyltransferase pncB2 [Andreesenia angusta]|uniref:Nicotinate phosphoribosyltransferase n=1 Tax=Andreesenia angusta TaxID=39480 RepID=A0A1S1V4H5_9FIRM|nr:nicotinate phosphoribosyltransferase [Andreesenia angusta]OHW61576.1 nicotinate phosphoribosyltransferase pncB2 [Andreesenia angusta]